jgi:hypothetical protein
MKFFLTIARWHFQRAAKRLLRYDDYQKLGKNGAVRQLLGVK